jgi:hypothetical protein
MKPIVSRREYKVMLDHRLFADRKAAAASFCRELHAIESRLTRIQCDGEFDGIQKRQIVFVDTLDETIHLNGFVFRQRTSLEDLRSEYTLKCRSPDRYVAAFADVRESNQLKGDEKLEEDIGVPFVSRFSHSNTVKYEEEELTTLKDAANIFPVLGMLQRDGDACPVNLDLWPVNSMKVFERVLTGPRLMLDETEAEVALILWSDGANGRPLVVEFSYRYKHKEENFDPKTARLAMQFFEAVQRMDWCLLNGQTKTQFAYRQSLSFSDRKCH